MFGWVSFAGFSSASSTKQVITHFWAVSQSSRESFVQVARPGNVPKGIATGMWQNRTSDRGQFEALSRFPQMLDAAARPWR